MPTFYDQFVEAEQRGPQNIALEIQRKDQVESYTFAETRKMAESIGRWMSEKKLPSGATPAASEIGSRDCRELKLELSCTAR